MKNYLLLALIFISPLSFSQNDENKYEDAYQKGRELYDLGDYEGAIQSFHILTNELSDDETAGTLWMLGATYEKLKNYQLALDYYERFKKVRADKWFVYQSLVQLYQANKNFSLRDENIKILYELKSANSDEELNNKPGYIRDRFIELPTEVLGIEEFTPASPNQIFYRFLIIKDGASQQFVSLGSYDTTTEITRELENKPEGWRLYHLDGYCGDSHKTYGFFEEKPSYDVVREMFVKIYNDKNLLCDI